MARTKNVHGLEINQDLEFQERSWVVQRIGWAVFAIVIALAALGFFGDGVLSQARAGEPGDELWVEYPRFTRFESNFRFTLFIQDGSRGDKITLELHKDFLEGIVINSVSPVPEAERIVGDWVSYTFSVGEGDAPFSVHFNVTPLRPGLRSGMVRLPENEPIRFSQFVYP